MNKRKAASLVRSDALLENIWLVHDGERIHTIHADNWISGQLLEFHRDGVRVATFYSVNWWKRADA